MNLTTLATLAEIFSGIGVIVSLLFVGFELRTNNKQAKLDNWSNQIDRFVDVYGRASSVELGNLIAKGRENYDQLTEGEKIAYGYYLEQLCICLEAVLHTIGSDVHDKSTMPPFFEKHIQHHLGCPGGIAWYQDFQQKRGFPPLLADCISLALSKMDEKENTKQSQH